MDSFGNTHNYIAVFFKSTFYIFEEFFCIKSAFREINKERIVAFVLAGKGRGSSKPAGVTSHDLNNGYGFFFINAGIQSDLAYC